MNEQLFLPLFEKLDALLEKGEVCLAIEGGSAGGKTTLAEQLAERYDCNIFHMDDFFLQPFQRTAERLAEAGGNVDRERFFEEVLRPVSEGKSVAYRRYDCKTATLLPPTMIAPKKLTVVEGAYSMHPALAAYYDLSVFLEIEPEVQRQRILKRNGAEQAMRFFEEWIPMERHYFEKTAAKERCDLLFYVGAY